MAMENPGKRVRFTSRLCSVNERYPSMVYLGFAFWFAWSRVTWPTIAKCSAAWAPVPMDISYSLRMHIVMNMALILCIFAFALCENRMGGLPESTSFLCMGGVLAVGGTIVLLLALRYAPTTLLFDIGSATAGMGMSILLLRCMLLFGVLAPSRVLLMAAIASCLAAIMNAFFADLPFAVSLLGFCILPLISMALFALSAFPAGEAQNRTIFPNRAESLTPTGSFWQFAFTVFFVSLAAESVVYFNSEHYDMLARQASTPLVDAAVVGVTVILIVYAVLFPRSYNYNNIYYPAILIIMLLLVLLFISPDGAVGPLVIARTAFQIFGILIWCLLSYIIHKSKLSAIKVFGFGYGLHMLGGIIGYVLGHQLNLVFVSDGSNLLFAYLIIAILVLAISIAIYPPRTMKDLLSTIPDDDNGPIGTEMIDGWERACNRVADEGNLTLREREVMLLLAKGRGSTYISESFGVSLSTIYTHTRNIYRKLDVHSREELMEMVDGHLTDATRDGE